MLQKNKSEAWKYTFDDSEDCRSCRAICVGIHKISNTPPTDTDQEVVKEGLERAYVIHEKKYGKFEDGCL